MTRTPLLHPVWLLDVDGVVNACARNRPPKAWPHDQWLHARVTADGHTWPIWAAQPVIEFIRRTHVGGYAEVRWHTTWQGFTDGLEAALGLPQLPTQEAPEFVEQGESLKRGEWWKWPAVRRLLDEGGPLVWTDDDAGSELTDPQKMQLLRDDVLMISPWVHVGLTPHHLGQISEFLGMEEA